MPFQNKLRVQATDLRNANGSFLASAYLFLDSELTVPRSNFLNLNDVYISKSKLVIVQFCF